jgi:hypothetical protein
VLTHGIRTIIIHNITSPKSKAKVFSISNLSARWGTGIRYFDAAAAVEEPGMKLLLLRLAEIQSATGMKLV